MAGMENVVASFGIRVLMVNTSSTLSYLRHYIWLLKLLTQCQMRHGFCQMLKDYGSGFLAMMVDMDL